MPAANEYSDLSSEDEEISGSEEGDREDECRGGGKRRRRSGRSGQRGSGRGSKSSWVPHEDELLTRLVDGGCAADMGGGQGPDPGCTTQQPADGKRCWSTSRASTC
jgi:hypothetical protein